MNLDDDEPDPDPVIEGLGQCVARVRELEQDLDTVRARVGLPAIKRRSMPLFPGADAPKPKYRIPAGVGRSW
jgi:hypothetical protein